MLSLDSFFFLAACGGAFSGFLIFLLLVSSILDEVDQIFNASVFSKHLLVSTVTLVRGLGSDFVAHFDIDFYFCPLPVLHPEPPGVDSHKFEVPLVL
jgi:hypothetical protein